ncbi:glycosyltransferase family 4 protein [Streptomyces sp. 549]|uniref:glycosyltransferase family 4 protein n=1 Tax=Streptomyces sp. 549 TaxID=3049076 RepID=UPI0024C24C6F|nr:glycosyltransferase family 4 protein [Streptomyces sp. 549]MDK1473063.1 glycosyltransferase family 4 protein [Streptomyces sp. 549]
MKISILLHNAYAIGGTTRTCLTLARTLTDLGHEVELVSVFRHRATPKLAPSPGVPVTALVDRRRGCADLADPLAHSPGNVFPPGEVRADQYHRLAEQRIIDWLARTDADVIISARTGLNVLLARFGPERAVLIGQEHLTHNGHPHRLRKELQRYYPRLDALVTMTAADARAHRTGLHLPRTRVLSIPNSVPAPDVTPVDGSAEVIVAAGRIVKVKRYGMLVSAFARVSADFPDWTLRIYGEGAEREAVTRRIQQLGLEDRAFMMGPATPIEAEWVKGSIAAVTSAQESFGMTIVEAMRCGLPVVSTDCPHGPAEIIQDGENGRLVPRHSVEAFGEALRELMADRDLRVRMGRVARQRAAERYAPERIARRYEQLLEELTAARGLRTSAPVPPSAPAPLPVSSPASVPVPAPVPAPVGPSGSALPSAPATPSDTAGAATAASPAPVVPAPAGREPQASVIGFVKVRLVTARRYTRATLGRLRRHLRRLARAQG